MPEFNSGIFFMAEIITSLVKKLFKSSFVLRISFLNLVLFTNSQNQDS
jgi:hypothetical protein